MDLLRLCTAGAVDDGKSTLIGRLLFDTRALFDDQVEAVERVSRALGLGAMNLALVTDGLRAEREQGITIDVAYRYFATPRRKFIIADTPGHVQYTRNMVTGASTAQLTLILVDARQGPTEQSRRHAFISGLLGVPHLVVCVNKMDLVDRSRERFEQIRAHFLQVAEAAGAPRPVFVPICAVDGGNVVTRDPQMPWYGGPTLLDHLEQVEVAPGATDAPLRLPVQLVLRAPGDDGREARAYAGQIASGTIREGDEVLCLPSGQRTRIAKVELGGKPLSEAPAPQSVSVRLAEEVDAGRGEMLVDPAHPPRVTREVDAVLCWMAQAPLRPGSRWLLKHTTRTVPAIVEALVSRADVNTQTDAPDPVELAFNDLGRVRIRTGAPLCVDAYREVRTTGSFILIDEATGATVAGGVIRAEPK